MMGKRRSESDFDTVCLNLSQCINFVQYVHRIAQEAFPDYPEVTYSVPLSAQQRHHHMDELKLSGTFFPHYPVCNQYTKINFRSQQDSEDDCSKDYKRPGRIGAGVLLFWCIEHRECIGFTILRSAESCQSVYNVLSLRFPVMPQYVIYDNAFNLYEVTLNLTCSMPTTAIQNYSKILQSFATVCIIRITRIVAERLIVSRILLWQENHRLRTNRSISSSTS
jgi:hypothetical protein